MPKPRRGESKKKYMKRCIPQLRNEGRKQDQAVAICSSVFDRSRRKLRGMTKNAEYQELGTNNISPAVRYEELDGERYLVAPVVMLTEGVHAGSNGPVFYSRRELARTPSVHNHKPIVVYHPEFDGQPISACDPIVLNRRSVGLVLASRYDNKLRAEAWLKDKKIDKVDERIRNSLESLKIMEVSTGLFSDNEKLATPREFGGKRYRYVAHNCRLDHLALLPDKKGACSIEDGAGLLQVNEEGVVTPSLILPVWLKKTGFVQSSDVKSETLNTLEKLLKDRAGNQWNGWIEEVFEDSVVYCNQGQRFHQDFISKNDEIKLFGDPEKVERLTQFRLPDGSLLGNDLKQEKKKMAKSKAKGKKELVDELIELEESGWDEEDRDGLMNLPDKKLETLIANAKATDDDDIANAKATDDDDDEDDDTADRKKKKVTVKSKKGAPNVENEEEADESVEAFLAKVPPSLREVFRTGAKTIANTKKSCITAITANKSNKFTKEQLDAMPLDQLENLAALARPEKSTADVNDIMEYLGQAAGASQILNQEDEDEIEDLIAPELKFEPIGSK